MGKKLYLYTCMMEKLCINIVLVSMVIVFVCSFASASPGIATFYRSYVPSACYGSTPKGNMIAAAGDALWDGGKVCGKKFTVTCTGPRNPVPHPCTGKSVTVQVVDRCPGCPSTLDLSVEAFDIIAKEVAGIINIDYHLQV